MDKQRQIKNSLHRAKLEVKAMEDRLKRIYHARIHLWKANSMINKVLEGLPIEKQAHWAQYKKEKVNKPASAFYGMAETRLKIKHDPEKATKVIQAVKKAYVAYIEEILVDVS